MTLSNQLRSLKRTGRPALRRAAARLAKEPAGVSAEDLRGIQRAISAPGPLSPAVLRSLQQTSGNQLVQRLVGATRRAEPAPPRRRPQAESDEASAAPAIQRQDEALLSAAQVEKARAWYASQPERYTPAIITQIQDAVGAEPDGVIGPETIQAVARFQAQNPPLAVDGMAGPRTLPTIFSSGLAEEDSIDEYVEEAQEVQEDWDTLGSAESRGQALAAAVNAKLQAAGVPSCNVSVADIGQNAGQFDFATWTLELGQEPFGADAVSDAEAADMADTVYHEARHAEQWFRMAQLRAGQGRSAAEIADEMGIPPHIAAEAVAAPLARGSMEALIAQGWYDSVYGRDAEHRNRVLELLEQRGNELEAAQAAHDADPSPENEVRLDEARREFRKAHADYMNLPEEADAWRVGGAVTEAYLSEDDDAD